MARGLSPFTRLTLLISELKGNELADLTDVKRCDLAHHATQLRQEFANTPQKGIADRINEQAQALLTWIRAGESHKAEEGRQALLISCGALKDVL